MATFSPNVSAISIKQTATGIANENERLMLRGKFFAEQVKAITGEKQTELTLDPVYQDNLSGMTTELLALKAWYDSNCPILKQFTDLTVF